MKAPPFSYVRPASLNEVFQQWSSEGADATLLAGGQPETGAADKRRYNRVP